MPFFHIPRGENMHIRNGVFRGGFPFRFVGQPSDRAIGGALEANGWSREVLYAELFTDRSATHRLDMWLRLRRSS